MPEFKKNTRFSGGRASSPRGGYSRDSRNTRDARGEGDRESFEAKCNRCGDMCQVPFKPNGKKPVYCRNCFAREEQGSNERFPKRDFDRSRTPGAREHAPRDTRIDELSTQMKAMQKTLEQILSAIEEGNRADALTREVRKHLPKGSA